MMKFKLVFLSFIIFAGATVFGRNTGQGFDKQAYYAVLKSGKTDDVNQQLDALSSSSVSEKEAYEGALLMRKAGLVKVPGEKLKLFKKGRIKLETALLKDADNGEYHFLRLIIQENAPKIVKYKANLETDKQIIIKAYKNLPSAVQHAIMDYSKSSKILHPQDL